MFECFPDNLETLSDSIFSKSSGKFILNPPNSDDTIKGYLASNSRLSEKLISSVITSLNNYFHFQTTPAPPVVTQGVAPPVVTQGESTKGLASSSDEK
jgi:hypothetical protein